MKGLFRRLSSFKSTCFPATDFFLFFVSPYELANKGVDRMTVKRQTMARGSGSNQWHKRAERSVKSSEYRLTLFIVPCLFY
jgi:hypothetical protein